VTLRFLLYCIRFLEQWLSHIVRKSHSEYWYCHSICGRRCNSPGAAAPGDVLLHLVQNHHFFGFLQPVGLVDYESLKKSIWRFLLFSRLCLKEFTDDTEISSSDKLFQQFMTRWEKNYNRVCSDNVYQFPAVISSYLVFGAVEKECPWSWSKTSNHFEDLNQVCFITKFL